MEAALVAALIAAGVAVSASAIGSSVSAAGSGNKERIKELKQATRRGDLTASGEALAMTGFEEAKRAEAASADRVARQLAASGATSAADIVAIQEQHQAEVGKLYERLGDRRVEMKERERGELGDRLAYRRRQRALDITSSIKAGVGAGSAAAQSAALKDGKDKPLAEPDFKTLDKTDPQVSTETRAFIDAARAAGKSDDWINSNLQSYLGDTGA